jgi:hypothetical protein
LSDFYNKRQLLDKVVETTLKARIGATTTNVTTKRNSNQALCCSPKNCFTKWNKLWALSPILTTKRNSCGASAGLL